MNEHIDMKISGASSMPGGEYGRVSISGAGKVQGSLKCEEMHCSGASNVQGDVDCAGELCTSGAGKVAGSVRCGSLTASGTFSAQTVQVEGLASVSGSLRTEQALTADELRASGSLEAGSVHCRALRSSGSCRISGDIEAETAVLSGAVQIGGLLNAETVEISVNPAVHISAIGGGTIRVLQKDTATVLGIFRTSPAVRASARSRATTSSWRMSRLRSFAANTSASGTAAASERSNTAKIWKQSTAPSATARRPVQNKCRFCAKL